MAIYRGIGGPGDSTNVNLPSTTITSAQITNWNTAYSWGDHSTEGYLTSYTETDPVVGAITGIVKANGAGIISAAVAGEDFDAAGTAVALAIALG